MKSYTGEYFSTLKSILEKIEETQSESIKKLASKILQTIKNGKCVYAFGCTHGGIMAQEAFYRAGGLVIINPIFPPGLTCDVVPVTLSSKIERLESYGKLIAEESGLESGDLLIIHSVSGRNPVCIDMALRARELGVFIAAVTNIEYSSSTHSRHSSGKRLFEAADIIIDNCGELGDAAVDVEGIPQKVSPTSTVSSAAIINAVAAEAAALFVKDNMHPPVFLSANLDGGDEHNRKVMEIYKNQIKYLNSTTLA